MGITSIAKLIGPGSKPQPLAPLKPKIYEKLKAVGYGILAVITALAILAIAAALSFLGAGFVFAHLYGPGGLSIFAKWFSNTLLATLILTPILSIYPIKKIAGSIFAKAKPGIVT